MRIETEHDLEQLKRIGGIVARTMQAMGKALEPGMTTRDLDAMGRTLLERDGARSAPELTYGFPGATCISVFPAIAHGIPSERTLRPGDLVNIDVSAEREGYVADTGASFVVPPRAVKLEKLMRHGREALQAGMNAVRVGARLSEIGLAIQSFTERRGLSLIRNLSSHGVGRALHEAPETIPTWYEPRARTRITNGLVFTIEPFVSLGANWAVDAGDGWTLNADKPRATVQYEHSLVATPRGAVVLTRA